MTINFALAGRDYPMIQRTTKEPKWTVVRQFEKLQRLYSPRSEEERVRRKAATKAPSRLADREKQD